MRSTRRVVELWRRSAQTSHVRLVTTLKESSRSEEKKEIVNDSMKSEYVDMSNLIDQKQVVNGEESNKAQLGTYDINREMASDKRALRGKNSENRERNEKIKTKVPKGQEAPKNYDVDPGAG